MPDVANPKQGTAKFALGTGVVDPIEHIHGQCPFPTWSALSGSPIDFFLCSEELLLYILVGIISTKQGGFSYHFTLSMDIAIHSLWNLLVEEANESWSWGFRSGNMTKLLDFVKALHSELAVTNNFDAENWKSRLKTTVEIILLIPTLPNNKRQFQHPKHSHNYNQACSVESLEENNDNSEKKLK